MISLVREGKCNIIASLPNGLTFTTSSKNFYFIEKQLMTKSHLEHEIRAIKCLLIRKKPEQESEEDEME